MAWSTAARRACALTSLLITCVIAAGCSTGTGPDGDARELETTSIAPPEAFWSVNGEVEALALVGNTLYVGGDFSQISPRTGPLVALSQAGKRLTRFPQVGDGVVNSIVDDGHGGWFVGGEFDRIAEVRCANLVHITQEMRVSRNWCPRPRGEVTALARRDSTLYVGGVLRRIGGKQRRTLAAVDTRTGRALTWNPDTDYFVTDLEVYGRTLYVLGSFGEIGRKRHGSLAAVDAITGAIEDWDPRPPIDEHGDPLVRDIAVSDAAVYGAGSILVAYDRRTGKRIPWNPLPRSSGYTAAVEIAGGRLYVGGTFSRIAGQRRSNLASFDANSGQLTGWSPKGEPIGALAAQGSRVFTAENGGIRAYNATSGRSDVGFENPRPNGAVRALAASPSRVIVGGAFEGAAGVMRNGLAALDVRTGAPTPWDPELAGGSPNDAVYSIVTDGSTVFVGGLFKRARGVGRNALVAIDSMAGQPTTFSPAISGYSVNSLALDGSTLYVGGEFESASREPRDGNAAFDVSSGQLLDWYPVKGYIPIVAHDDTVILGRRSLAAVDKATGTQLQWETSVTAFRVPSIDVITVADGRVFFGGFFETVAGEPRKGLAAVEADSGELHAWDPGIDHLEFSHALAVQGDTVYVGSFAGLRAVHRETGTTQFTYSELADERVDALVVAGATVFVGTEHGLVVVPTARRPGG